MEKRHIHLTKRENQILDILWDTNEPMTASEIVSSCPDLTKSTVQAVLRKLLTNKYIEVADIVHSGTVLCRKYRPTFSRSQFIASQLKRSFSINPTAISRIELFSGLLGDMEDSSISLKEIEEMEKMLEKYKEKLQNR